MTCTKFTTKASWRYVTHWEQLNHAKRGPEPKFDKMGNVRGGSVPRHNVEWWHEKESPASKQDEC